MIAAALLRNPARALVPDGLDTRLLMAVALLASLGLVMVASASISFAAHNYGDGFYFVKRHLVYLAMGLMIGLVMLRIPLSAWFRSSNLVAAAVIVLMLAVLVPGIGREVNGARRWIGLGIINLQVAEVAKLAAIIFLAGYLQRHRFEMREIWHSFSRPLALIGVMVLLLLAQPDFGSSVVILATAMGLFFLAGIRLWIFAIMLGSGVGLLALLAVMSPYRMQRLVSFLNPWSDMYNTGYQLTQSLIAFGRGEWLGVGLGNSVQKLFYLPEAHTDFVFAIYAEETGLVGVVLVVALFIILVQRIFAVARKAVRRQDWFAAYVAFGVGILIAGQAFINIGVTSGLLPTKGLTLPFISYGGSSFLVSCAMIAIVLRIGVEMDDALWASRRETRG